MASMSFSRVTSTEVKSCASHHQSMRRAQSYSKVDGVEACVRSWQAIHATSLLNGEAIDAVHALQRLEAINRHFARASGAAKSI